MSELQATLQRLAAQPYTENAFLSLYLDWTVDGNGQRQAPRIAEQELHRLAGELPAHAGTRASFESDRERILTYLDREAPADARSLAIFACDAEGVWEALPLQAHMQTEVALDRYPHLFGLARVLDKYETYVVVLADGQQSRILLIDYSDIRPIATTAAPEKIKRFDQGGEAQMLFQRRTDNLIKAHTKDIAQELGRITKRHNVPHIIIAANDSIKGIVMSNLPDTLKAKLVDYVKIEPTATTQDVLDTLAPVMEHVEHEQEGAALAKLQEQHYADGLGVAGIADTAQALSKGQVERLLMQRGFTGRGGECPSCGTLRAGQRDTCPYDGTRLRPVDLREAFVAYALRQNAEVEIIENGEYLGQHENVGALLRYREQMRNA